MIDPDDATRPDDETRENERSDIQQAVAARSDAVARGEGGKEPETLTAPGLGNGESGAAGVVRNQDDDAQ